MVSNVDHNFELSNFKICSPGGEKFDLTCKVALVTGGTHGIGYSVVSELLCAGIRHVAITGLNKCKGKEAMDTLNNLHGCNRVTFYESNITNVSEIQGIFLHMR